MIKMKNIIYLLLVFLIFFSLAVNAGSVKKKEADATDAKKVTRSSALKINDSKEETTSKFKTDFKTNTSTSESSKINQPANTEPKIDIPSPFSSSSALIGEQINWQVIAGGATDASSANYLLKGTLGQSAVGLSSSADYECNQGFWQSFVTGCCTGIRGNIDGDPNDQIDIADLVYFVDYSFGTPPGPAPPCLEEADVDASGQLDIADIVYMVNYMFGTPTGPAPLSC